jgi:hypothetical protein
VPQRPLLTNTTNGSTQSKHALCRGICPGASTNSFILCEGSCSHLASWMLQQPKPANLASAKVRRSRLPLGYFLALLLVVVLGSARHVSAATIPAGEGSGGKGKSFDLTVKGLSFGKGGASAVAAIQVIPKGGYKMNLEFPLKLKVSGPPAAKPRELEMTAKQATKLTKALLIMKPVFTLTTPGAHAFKGTLRFSICTEKQCEIKTETLTWTTTVHSPGVR